MNDDQTKRVLEALQELDAARLSHESPAHPTQALVRCSGSRVGMMRGSHWKQSLSFAGHRFLHLLAPQFPELLDGAGSIPRVVVVRIPKLPHRDTPQTATPFTILQPNDVCSPSQPRARSTSMFARRGKARCIACTFNSVMASSYT